MDSPTFITLPLPPATTSTHIRYQSTPSAASSMLSPSPATLDTFPVSNGAVSSTSKPNSTSRNNRTAGHRQDKDWTASALAAMAGSQATNDARPLSWASSRPSRNQPRTAARHESPTSIAEQEEASSASQVAAQAAAAAAAAEAAANAAAAAARAAAAAAGVTDGGFLLEASSCPLPGTDGYDYVADLTRAYDLGVPALPGSRYGTTEPFVGDSFEDLVSIKSFKSIKSIKPDTDDEHQLPLRMLEDQDEAPSTSKMANSATQAGKPPATFNSTVSDSADSSFKPGRKLGRWQRLWVQVSLHPLTAFWLVLLTVVTMGGGGTFTDGLYGFGTRVRCFGYLYTAAKTGGGMLLVTWPLVLVSMCRVLLTGASTTWLNRVFPFVHHLLFHKLLVGIGCMATLLHVGCHLARAIVAIKIPVRHECRKAATLALTLDTQKKLWLSDTVIKGELLLLVLVIMCFVAIPWHRKITGLSTSRIGKTLFGFDSFWWTHKLQYVFWALFWMHPLRVMFVNHRGHNNGTFALAWWFMMLPCATLVYQKVKRTWCELFLKPRIISARRLDSDALELKLSKPSGWVHKPGMFARIKIPAISHAEWHPFSITSSPDDPFISFLIRIKGDWTMKLADLLCPSVAHCSLKSSVSSKSERSIKCVNQCTQTEPQGTGLLGRLHSILSPAKPHRTSGLLPTFQRPSAHQPSTTPTPWPSVHLEGPFLAPSQEQDRFSNLVLVGGGIGVTPMLAIVRDACYKLGMTSTMDWLRSSDFSSASNPFLDTPEADGEPLLRRNQGRWADQQWQQLVESASLGAVSRKIHFYWVVPDTSALCWLEDTLQLVDRVKGWGMISITICVTRARSKAEVVQALPVRVQGKVDVRVGRPNWDTEVGILEGRYPKQDVGVFFCGPPALGSSIWESCLQHSTDGTRFRCFCEKF